MFIISLNFNQFGLHSIYSFIRDKRTLVAPDTNKGKNHEKENDMGRSCGCAINKQMSELNKMPGGLGLKQSYFKGEEESLE